MSAPSADPSLDPSKLAALGAALAKAVATARGVGKDARNEHHKYDYASSESIIDEGRSALSSAGLTLLQTSVRLVPRELDGNVVPLAISTFLLLHEAGGMLTWEREWPVLEGKGRPLDKVHAGSLTTSLAYAIRDVLCLPRDNEAAGAAAMNRRDDRDYEPDNARRRQEEEPRREQQPANDQRGDDRAPVSSTAPTADAGDEYEAILAEIRRYELEAMEARINRSSLKPDVKQMLHLIAEGLECQDEASLAKVGARLKKLAPAFEDIARQEIRKHFSKLMAKAS
jgi:hypothetical protein